MGSLDGRRADHRRELGDRSRDGAAAARGGRRGHDQRAATPRRLERAAGARKGGVRTVVGDVAQAPTSTDGR